MLMGYYQDEFPSIWDLRPIKMAMSIVRHQAKHNSKICRPNLGKWFHVNITCTLGEVHTAHTHETNMGLMDASEHHSLAPPILHAPIVHTWRLSVGQKGGLFSTLDTYSSKTGNYSSHLHTSHSGLRRNLAYSDSGLSPGHSHLHVQGHSCKLRGNTKGPVSPSLCLIKQICPYTS